MTRSSPEELGSVVLVHDYLNQRGGAERVVLQMAETWPRAPIYTTLYRPDSTYPEYRAHDVRTSFLDRAPVDAGFRKLFPLYPAAIRALGTIDADVVISSSSGWAHAVRTSSRALHVTYCYTPARWLHFHEPAAGPALPAPIRRPFQRWDVRAAQRADVYLAISQAVRERIRRVYGRDAAVVYPPVDVDRFRPSPRGERVLVVGRLLTRKRVDLVIEASRRAGLGLDIVGDGPALDDLRRTAGPNVRFHGTVTDRELTEMYEACRCVCLLCFEDFGLTPVEAQAAGKPVVVFAAGGALETVVEGETGVFFHEHSPEAVLAALRRCDAIATPPEAIAEQVRRFSLDVFRERFVSAVLAARDGAARGVT